MLSHNTDFRANNQHFLTATGQMYTCMNQERPIFNFSLFYCVVTEKMLQNAFRPFVFIPMMYFCSRTKEIQFGKYLTNLTKRRAPETKMFDTLINQVSFV